MGTTLLVIGYALIWLGLLGYVGWLALRMRGVRADVEAARDLLERRYAEIETARGPVERRAGDAERRG